jgi:hypothetical protein
MFELLAQQLGVKTQTRRFLLNKLRICITSTWTVGLLSVTFAYPLLPDVCQLNQHQLCYYFHELRYDSLFSAHSLVLISWKCTSVVVSKLLTLRNIKTQKSHFSTFCVVHSFTNVMSYDTQRQRAKTNHVNTSHSTCNGTDAMRNTET